MIRRLVPLLLILCAAQIAAAQSYLTRGSVTDTLNVTPLYRASVVLLRASDSVIESYTRTGTDGHFILKAAKTGRYTLRVTFPGFADYTEVVNITKDTTDLGDLPMVSKAHLLKEFVLTKQVAAIKIKGDTTEYMADSFNVRDNATVEDLLKKLPGIQVDKNGQVTAQGETVQKILVDGEEFFADDPKVVTKGLQANTVEKVQVFDKKSDQAEFTGVDDGQKTKTINLELKEDKKKGYFGKVDVGGGTDGFYENQAMINAFKAKRQVSAFGIVSNTDKVGLGWEERGKFGGDNQMNYEDGSEFIMVNNNDDNFGSWDGTYRGEGFPRVWTGGAHYADKWNADKKHITGNYRYAKQNVEATGVNTVQNTLKDDSSNVTVQDKVMSSMAERHGADAMYEWKIDSNNSIKITAAAGTKKTDVYSRYNTQVSLLTTEQNVALYHNARTIFSRIDANYNNADVLYKRKFAKKGRTLSLNLKENSRASVSSGHLSSSIIPDTANSKAIDIDQDKTNNSDAFIFSAKAVYTEPLSKKTNLELNYGITINNTTAKNFSYNNDGAGSYTTLDTLFSSHYKYNIQTNTGGLNLRFINKKINLSVGSDVSNASYLQTDLLHNDTTRRTSFLNLFPKASFRYSVSKQQSFRFNYYGSTRQPSITQVQTLRQNTDPTNITIGNPALKQEFTHKFDLNFNDYKVLSHRWIYANVNANFVNNAISSSHSNKYGVDTNQFINVNGNYSGSAWMGSGFKLKKPELNISLNLNANISHTINYINGIKNINDNNSYSPSLRFSIDKDDKYDFSFNPGVTYNENRATINTNAQSYWSFNGEFDGSVELPFDIEVGSDVNFMFRQATAAFPNNNSIIKWNAFITKKFLKKKQLALTLSALDILNQNIGYERTAQAGIITQNNYATIRRYFLLNLQWNFTHTPGTVVSGDD